MSRITRYGPELTSHDVLKLVALLLMTLDHIGAHLYPDALWLRALGRGAFPLFFFLAGYSPSRHFKYDILWVAIAVSIVHVFTYHPLLPLNALFAYMLARWTVLRFGEQIAREPLVWWVTCSVFILPTLLLWEYGSFALLFAFFGYLVRIRPAARSTTIFGLLTILIYPLCQLIYFDFSLSQLVCVCAIMAAAGYGMWRFTPRHYPLANQPVKTALQYLSRYSLYYYLLHLAALEILAAYVLGIREAAPFQLIAL